MAGKQTMHGRRFVVLAWWLAVLPGAVLVAALAGCGRAPEVEAQAVDISGEIRGAEFRLPDQTGRTRTLAEFRGKVVVLFFGFTRCPEVCPTTLSDLALTRKRLGPDGERVQVLFVTIDPERDSAEMLAQYVPAFDPSFIALRGDAQQTASVAREFKVSYQKVPGNAADHYTFDHTADTFVIDPAGRPRLKVPYGQGPDTLAKIIREVLADS
jgi:protein SCO1